MTEIEQLKKRNQELVKMARQLARQRDTWRRLYEELRTK